MGKKFDLNYWRNLINLDDIQSYVHNFSPLVPCVVGPMNFLAVTTMRNMCKDFFDACEKLPCDIILWGTGDSLDHTSFIGGIPNIDRTKWPLSKEDGEPMTFICQIDFSDSSNLVQVPNEIMLFFAHIEEDCLLDYEIMWVSSDYILKKHNKFAFNEIDTIERFYGEILRTFNYRIPHLCNTDEIVEFVDRYKKFSGYGMDYLCFKATTIGKYLFASGSDLNHCSSSELICKIHSMDYYSTDIYKFPFLNRNFYTVEDFLLHRSTFGREFNANALNIGDGGGILIKKTPDGSYVASVYWNSW